MIVMGILDIGQVVLPQVKIFLTLEKFSFQNDTGLNKKAVIVLGTHRSGTSTSSGILYMLGLDLGNAVMGGNECNPRGFFENYRIMFYNEDLLRKLHANWHNTIALPCDWWKSASIGPEINRLKNLILDDYRSDAPMLFKDPRICILLPVYLEVFKELGIEPFFVLAYRNPHAVAESLEKRDGFSPDKSFRIWLDHMLKAEKYSREYSRMFIDFGDILADPLSLPEKIQSFFLPEVQIMPGIREKILQFVEPELNHYTGARDPETGENEESRTGIFELFRQFARQQDTAVDHEYIDSYSTMFYATYGSAKWPKISVIIMAGNDPAALEKTILSVVTQDYPDLESIVIGKDPEMAVQAVIEKYKHLLSLWINEPGHGRADASTSGLEKASGKWKILIDAGEAFSRQSSLTELAGRGEQS
jgi:hypothetical protein